MALHLWLLVDENHTRDSQSRGVYDTDVPIWSKANYRFECEFQVASLRHGIVQSDADADADAVKDHNLLDEPLLLIKTQKDLRDFSIHHIFGVSRSNIEETLHPFFLYHTTFEDTCSLHPRRLQLSWKPSTASRRLCMWS